MNFVDKFILDESLDNFELVDADFNDIALGIILGNLDKVMISPKFCDSLSKNEKISPMFKGLFLKRIFQDFYKEIENISEKAQAQACNLIQRFNSASELLYEIFELVGELTFSLETIYRDLFLAITKKYCIVDLILTVVIQACNLRSKLSLESTFFLLNQKELILIHQKRYSDFQLYINLYTKCCEIVGSKGLNPSDCLSIITFNSLYDFCLTILQQDDHIDYSKVIDILIRFSKNFSLNQKIRFRDFYTKLLSESKIHRPIENFEIAFRDKNFSQSKRGDQQSYRKDFGSKPAPHPNKPNYHKQYHLRTEDYNACDLETEKNREKDRNVKAGLEDLLSSIRHYCKTSEISIEILSSNLSDLMSISLTGLHYHLAEKSYYEKNFTQSSVLLWQSICKALKQIPEYPRRYLDLIKSHYHYIKSNS